MHFWRTAIDAMSLCKWCMCNALYKLKIMLSLQNKIKRKKVVHISHLVAHHKWQWVGQTSVLKWTGRRNWFFLFMTSKTINVLFLILF